MFNSCFLLFRYGQWTADEYYKSADEHLRENDERKMKLNNLELRRDKLRKMLNDEQKWLEQQLKGLLPNRRISEYFQFPMLIQ